MGKRLFKFLYSTHNAHTLYAALRSISVLEVLLWKIGIFLLLLKIFMKVNNRLCVGSEMFLANPRKLFSFAIYITLSCQILDIVITLVVDETHQSGKRLKSQRNSSQVHIKQVCAIWVFLFYERTNVKQKSLLQRRWIDFAVRL